MSEVISPEERDRLVAEFESMGSLTFRVDEDRAEFEAIEAYLHGRHVPTHTDVDEDAGTITISKRPIELP